MTDTTDEREAALNFFEQLGLIFDQRSFENRFELVAEGFRVTLSKTADNGNRCDGAYGFDWITLAIARSSPADVVLREIVAVMDEIDREVNAANAAGEPVCERCAEEGAS